MERVHNEIFLLLPLSHLYHSLQHVSSRSCDPGSLCQVAEVREEGEEEEEDSIVQLFLCGTTGVVQLQPHY